MPPNRETAFESQLSATARQALAAKRAAEQFDVFLCHHSPDKPLVRKIGEALKKLGLLSWLDVWELRPGLPWQRALEDRIENIQAAAVFVGASGIGPWQTLEIEAYLREFVNRGCPVIPVILPDCEKTPRLPVFLRGMTWVDFRREDPNPLEQLAWGISGQHADELESWQRQVLADWDGAALTQETTPASLPADQPIPKSETPAPRGSSPPDQVSLTLAPGVTLELRRVPGGEFQMGSKEDDQQADEDEKPQHRLHLEEYWIGRYPVTVAQFAAFIQASGYQTTAEKLGSGYVWNGTEWKDVRGANWRQPRGPESTVKEKQNHPVTQVSWDDALAFCAWASSQSSWQVRLPSEAEWEKAARGSDGRIFPWGNQAPNQDLCNFNDDIKDTTPVGRYSPQGDSPYDCADMAGNVWEWTRSLYGTYTYPQEGAAKAERESLETVAPRVQRGGSFNDVPGVVRCACRNWSYPDLRYNNFGFRVVVSPSDPGL